AGRQPARRRTGVGAARMRALARVLDDRRGTPGRPRAGVAPAGEVPIPLALADTFFDVVCRAGWARSSVARPIQEGGGPECWYADCSPTRTSGSCSAARC